MQVAAAGVEIKVPDIPFAISELLHGNDSQEIFYEQMHRHMTIGYSGVARKKFSKQMNNQISRYEIPSFLSRKDVVKSSTQYHPFLALNMSLGMQVSAKILPTAKTEISDDGQVILVDRIDKGLEGEPNRGFEDFCALLGMQPSAKYDLSWERIAKAVCNLVPGRLQRGVFRRLAAILLLTHALRNATCHAKNIALFYSRRSEIRLAPVYDMLTTGIYSQYQDSPPAIALFGKRAWFPSRALHRFISAAFGLPLREQLELVDQISDAISDTTPMVRQAMGDHPAFKELGSRMLRVWSEGVNELRGRPMSSTSG